MSNPKFTIFTGSDSQFYFRLVGGNGKTILQSEGYTSRQNCENGISSVRTNATNRDMFREHEANDGRPYFTLNAANGQVIATSQMYSTRQAMQDGIEAVMNTAPDAPLED